jgi:hypothetical protein
MVPNGNERSHAGIAQEKSSPNQRAENQRPEELHFEHTDVSGYGAAQITRKQDRTQDRRAWNQID